MKNVHSWRKALGCFLSFLFIAMATVTSAAAQSVVVPVMGTTPTLTPVTINSSPGDQSNPHVSGDWVTYTSDNAIRYYNFNTGVDAQIPLDTPISGITWIWAPGITAATAPAELAQFFFTKSITLAATPTAANILVAADDFAEVLVNGTVVGTTGSTTDFSVALAAANSLKEFDIRPYLTAGANTITIRGQNGIGAFGGCTSCTYRQNPAGILVSGFINSFAGGTVIFASDTSWQAFAGATALGSAQNVCLTASVPANCPAGATLYGFSGGGWTAHQSSARDLLSDISGSKIVFSRIITLVGVAVMVFDAATPWVAPLEIDPALGTTRLGSAIGGDTVAYIDYGLEGNGELVIHDLVSNTSVRITNDTAYDQNPSVSPDGNVVTWEHCGVTPTNCDIWQAVKSGGSWTVSVVSAGPEENPDSNGALVVYDSQRGPESDLFWRAVAGGAETQLQMAGFQYNPSIAGDFIAFESRPTLSALDTTDIFVYDIVNNRLFQITNTPLVNEELNDITLLPDGSLRVVWASDEDGPLQRNVKAATFRLPSGDVTPPVLTVPANLTVNATSPSGAVVSYVVTATDAVDPSPTVSCAPASGSSFSIGTTVVMCTATDASGNSSHASFNVTVKGASGQIADLIALVTSFNLRQGITNSLDAKLQNVLAALSAAGVGDIATACNKLNAFINEVQAQSGKAITTLQADQLLAQTAQVKGALGCP
jgi:HYR domain